jgi:hypothetical protein
MLNAGVERLGRRVLRETEDVRPLIRVSRPARVISRKRSVRMLRTT